MFYVLSLSLCFLLHFRSLSHYPSLFFLFLCHIHKLVLSFCQIPIAEIHRRQQISFSEHYKKWCFKMHLFFCFQLLCFNLVFQCFLFRPLTCFKVCQAETYKKPVTADILTYHSRKRRGLWWLNSTKLLLFQGLDVVHMGSCHTVMAYCNTWIPKGLFIVTINDTKSETQVKKSARMKASCWNSNEGSRTSLTICLNTSDRAKSLECNSHINKTRSVFFTLFSYICY